VVDTVEHRVTLARAGHELPLFSRRNQLTGVPEGSYVGCEGMPLGMVPDELFRSVIMDCTEPFVAGDNLVLYTDGITEAPNEEDKEFSGTRLADTVRTLHGRSARDLNDGILENVHRFAGTALQRDDLTLVTVKCTA
jgi:sigma-B regulation protein RsbU (phosphoserine phosphatase)